MAERPLTEHIRPGEQPPDLAAYERLGGYRAAKRMLREMDARGVQALVKDSGLRGRGGAGFPTAAKWSFVPLGDDAPRPKYLIANADEMEPGTFKDRVLLEGNPHQLLEGMLIAAYAIDADHAYIFLRWEYRLAARLLQRAIDEAYSAGYLGPRVLDSGYGLELALHVSGGRYICGEETALLNALEGKRATPRAKPPFPQVSGLFGKPTIVQNVETLCNLPHIVEKGAAWFKGLARSDDAGTKIYGVSGKVRRPCAVELPMGTPMREILEEHAGGMQDGLALRGWLPGGASTDFLLPEHLDLPMDFASIQKAGSRLGTGTAIVLDDRTCPVGMMLALERFFARESCGWCTPCRDGLPWVERILRALEEGGGRLEDLELLEKHCKWLGPGNTFCALAPGAVEPLQSGLKYFRDEFERHVTTGCCPYPEAP